jgi:hypothetical protein
MATSLSSSSSDSSSRVRFWPRLSGVAASTGGFSGSADLVAEDTAVEDPGMGALKMLCWRSVTSTLVAAVGGLNVPSSLAMMFDLDLAYVTC